MSHPNARLTVVARTELVQQVGAGWPQAEVARQFRVSRATVNKWWRRYRRLGVAGLQDRTSRPQRSPHQTSTAQQQAICATRRERGWGPHRIGWLLRLPHSTVYAVLKRAGLARLAWLHRTTRQIVRYERTAPGELLHLDVKKLARIPQGGGRWAMPGMQEINSGPRREPGIGFDFLHVAIDDYSRLAYAEALTDERGLTTAGFLQRTLVHFAAQGVHVERILTDNGKNYTSQAFRQVAEQAGIRLKRTRPFRPQTNGKAEAFNKILLKDWAYLRPYHSNAERLAHLPGFLNYYNHERPHGGIAGIPPAARL